ncbi:MAG: response regulator [Treponema sp.]|jgi:CheY-like chemotaxis protein/HPt (histidine-containing phosphotransfer) domain-containing protein|nr:response regulator [Treponema sp.]
MENNNAKTIYAPDAKILIVDDIESNLYVVKKLLMPYGSTIDTVTSGAGAIEKIKGGAIYDIIFMDHMMPEMDGIETVKIIREMGITMPVIALTASNSGDSKEMFLAAGMNDLLTKPIDKALLEKQLVEWIPSGKFTGPPPKPAAANAAEVNMGLRKSLEQIKEISIQTGLDRVTGQWDIYEKLLKLTVKEFEKRNKNLNEFLAAGDMHNFCVEIHGLKSALANIGASELSDQARDMEDASGREDAVFCSSNLPRFLEGLAGLNSKLMEAFSKESQNLGPITIPAELPSVFEKLKTAFEKNDFEAMDEGMQSLNALMADGALKEEIDKINEAVLMIDYKGAMKVMDKLLG